MFDENNLFLLQISGKNDGLEIDTMLMHWLLEHYAAMCLYYSLKRLSQAILDKIFPLIMKRQLHLLFDCLIELKFGHLNVPFEF